MTLPKKTRQKLKSPQGQILILFLLILVVGLAVVLSVASRTVTDIRITTTSDESNRAYFAAEAAIEEALKRVSAAGASGSTFTLDFDDNQSSATVAITEDAPTGAFVYPSVIEKDSVAQIALMEPFSPPNQTNLTNGNWLNGTSLTFFWGDGSGTDPAIEVSIVYATNSGGWAINPGNIKKIIFEPDSSRIGGACTPSFSPSPSSPLDFTPDFEATINLFSASVCNDAGLTPVTQKPVLARVRMLYEGSPLAVEGNVPLPPQGFKIDSSGNTPSGVTRRIDVTRLYSSVSPLFDYVLFNGGSNTLEK